MSMEDVHRRIAQVVGELSLACVRGSAPRAAMERWVEVMRATADAFEAKMQGRPA